MKDRIDDITALLLGAAYADDHFHDSERTVIGELLGKLLGGELPAEVTQQIETFDSAAFDVAACSAKFTSCDEDQKYKLLELVAAVHEADDEFDFAEDEYVRAVAAGMNLADKDLSRFTITFVIEDIQEGLGLVTVPPPVPK